MIEYGEIGTAGDRLLSYALYCLVPTWASPGTRCDARDHLARGLALFSRPAGAHAVQLLFARANPEIGAVHYERPALVPSAFGLILYLPVVIDGTGHGNASEYYRYHDRAWESLDSETWVADLVTHLPKGLQIWKGIWPDLHTMKAEASLYRPDDGNCCPTGGVVRIWLAIRDRRFVVDSLAVETPP